MEAPASESESSPEPLSTLKTDNQDDNAAPSIPELDNEKEDMPALDIEADTHSCSICLSKDNNKERFVF